MKYLRLLLWIVLLGTIHNPAFAWYGKSGTTQTVTKQYLYTNSTGAIPNNLGDKYYPVGYSTTNSYSNYKTGAIPISGKLTGIKFYIVTPPTGVSNTNTWQATIYKGTATVAPATTGLSCTITKDTIPAGLCEGTGNVSVSPGDYLTLVIHSTFSSGVESSIFSASVTFVPTTPNDTILLAMGNGYSTTSTVSVNPFDNGSMNIPLNRLYGPLPDTGVVDKLYVISNATGSGSFYDYTIDWKGSNTTVKCRITDPGPECNDPIHSFPTTALGDTLQFEAKPSTSPPDTVPTSTAVAALGARFVPLTPGSFPIMAGSHANAYSASSDTFYPLTPGVGTGGATEGSWQTITYAMTVKTLVVKVAVAPGAGKNVRFMLRKNLLDTTVFCDILNTATINTCTGFNETFSDNDLVDIRIIPTGSPVGTIPSFGILAIPL